MIQEESILNSIKKLLNISEEYFDQEIIIHINSVFTILNQIGIGPKYGFFIEDETSTWDEFTEDYILYNSVKTYIYLKVKLLFDPPANSSAIESINKAIAEYEWRLNVFADNKKTFE